MAGDAEAHINPHAQ